ncbi:MAG: iron-sulfur cluster assembly accessory protein [Phycisphaerae bacterium]|jgi:iron-sulfur cluster assembly protein|nr:iron-sulfur cluster assembly accessory protein [Phycisphaerae bacterium]MBT7656884.1 iron-sulfur cluster assembly accessory protein [Phycisphaerae bacterium]
MAVIVTELAAREISNIMNQQDLDTGATHLRVGVKGGGCSGFSYILDLTETKKEGDEQWDYSFDVEGNNMQVSVICDPKSYLYLNGTTVDFKDEVMGRGFVFENPNATNTCGCGSSFNA